MSARNLQTSRPTQSTQTVSRKLPTVPAKRDFPKIDKFFDSAEHIVERSETLLSKSKPAIISLFLLLHLIIDLIVVLIFVLKK
jgi:hypothetical protein